MHNSEMDKQRTTLIQTNKGLDEVTLQSQKNKKKTKHCWGKLNNVEHTLLPLESCYVPAGGNIYI